MDPLNKLCKWRQVLAGWHHGTKAMNANGNLAMRDLMDKWLIARCEATAIATLLINKGLLTSEEVKDAIFQEATLLDMDMEKQFPGFRTDETGVVIYDTKLAHKTTKDLGFPP